MLHSSSSLYTALDYKFWVCRTVSWSQMMGSVSWAVAPALTTGWRSSSWTTVRSSPTLHWSIWRAATVWTASSCMTASRSPAPASNAWGLTCPTLKSTPTLHQWLRLLQWAGAGRDSVAAVSFYDEDKQTRTPHADMSFKTHYSPFDGFIPDQLGECATLFIDKLFRGEAFMTNTWPLLRNTSSSLFYWKGPLDWRLQTRDHQTVNQLTFITTKHTFTGVFLFHLWTPKDLLLTQLHTHKYTLTLSLCLCHSCGFVEQGLDILQAWFSSVFYFLFFIGNLLRRDPSYRPRAEVRQVGWECRMK